jgi:His-Xaa-Ser system protein HxsD
VEIKLSSKVYPLEAIMNACYAFIEKAYIFLDTDARNDFINVSFKGKGGISKKRFEAIKGEFMNELLHCALRYEIGRNNRKIREYIVGRALYSDLSSIDIVTSKDKISYQDDPLGIAKPWEKKYGKKRNAKKHKI